MKNKNNVQKEYDKALAKKKAPTIQTKDQIAESIINSITDHDIGWARVSNVASNGSKTTFILQDVNWNSALTQFKITVEPA